MRIVILAAVAVLALAVTGASQPASTATKAVKITASAFTPASVTINTGDAVKWTNSDTKNHQVVANNGAFASPTIAAGKTYTHVFGTAGTYRYHDALHPSLTGKVVVNGPPGSDTTPPALSKVSATGGRKCKKGQKNCKGRPTTLRFKLSEPATVKVKVPKHKGANVTRSAQAGSNTIKFSTSKLPPGKWTLNLSATDSSGNTSPVKPVTVKVKKG